MKYTSYNDYLSNEHKSNVKIGFTNNILNESGLSVSLTRDEFINSLSKSLFESNDEFSKDVHYAIFESYALYNSKPEWFSAKSNNNQKPLIIRTENSSVIFYNNECFSISNESFDILSSMELNEDIFSDAWGSVSNFFSNAWDGIKQVGEKVGDWVKEVSDSAKAVAGFAKIGYMAISVLQSNDWKSIASTIINISQTLASTYATSFNLDQKKLAATAAVSSGLINLYEGREAFLKGWGEVSNAKPTDSVSFGKSLVTACPESFTGISKMCFGIKDLALSVKPDIKFEEITNVEEFSSSDNISKLTESSTFLTKENEGEGLAKSILNTQGSGNFDLGKLNDYWKPLAICEIAFGVENVYPANKAGIMDGLNKAKEYIPKAKDFPTIIQGWISTAEKTQFTGGAAVIKDVIQTMGKPMVEAAKNFTSTVLPELINTAEWMGEVSKDYEKANKEIVANCKPSKTNLAVVTLPAVEPKEGDTKLSDTDLATLNKNLPLLANQFNVKVESTNSVKESIILSYKNWISKNS